MNFTNQRRMAAELLKCGRHRVWFDVRPDAQEHIAEAVTRKDIRQLIHARIIRKKQKRGNSRTRILKAKAQRAKGRRKGPGSRKGRAGARFPSKQRWMQSIRPLRRDLRTLRDTGVLDPHVYRQYYLKAKGGQFRNVGQLHLRLVTRGALKEDDLKVLARSGQTPKLPPTADEPKVSRPKKGAKGKPKAEPSPAAKTPAKVKAAKGSATGALKKKSTKPAKGRTEE